MKIKIYIKVYYYYYSFQLICLNQAHHSVGQLMEPANNSSLLG